MSNSQKYLEFEQPIADLQAKIEELRLVGSDNALNITEEPRRAGDPPELIAVADRVREVLGWAPKHDNLDTIVGTSLAWERRIAAKDPDAYWAD